MILVVDDDPTIVNLIAMILKRADYLVGTARSATDAFEFFEAQGPVDLVISDLRMPGMGGMDFLAALRADPRTREVPVIFCTSVADRETVTQAVAAGIKDFIVKPIVADVVLTKVKAIFDRMLPVMDTKWTVMNRNRIGEPEYRQLVIATVNNVENVAAELAAAGMIDDRGAMMDLTDRLDQMCATFGAERTRAALTRLKVAPAGSATAIATNAVVDQLAELRHALTRAAGPTFH